MKLCSYILVPTFRMCGAVPPLPRYLFKAFCLLKFTFTFTFTQQVTFGVIVSRENLGTGSAQYIESKVLPMHAMKTCRGNRDTAPPILYFALDGGEWSGRFPGRFTTGSRALGAHWTGVRAGQYVARQ